MLITRKLVGKESRIWHFIQQPPTFTLFSRKRKETKRKTSLEAPGVPNVVAIVTTAFYWILIYRVSIKNISKPFIIVKEFWLLLLAISGFCLGLKYIQWFIGEHYCEQFYLGAYLVGPRHYSTTFVRMWMQ